MSFSLVKDATKFAWKELYKNTDSWFMLCLKSFVMAAAMLLGLAIVIVLLTVFFGLVLITPNIVPFNLVWYAQLACALFLAVIIFMVLIKVISILFVPSANAIDVARGKVMRKFQHRVESMALLWTTFLMLLAILCGLIVLIIPGMVFAVRFSLAPYIALDERCGAIQAMSKSWALTKNNFVDLFPVVAWTVMLQLIPIVNLLNYFFPFTNLVMSFAYVTLKEKQS